ncbi:alpha/beta hydrolase [uncultured Litoreibacter sp.]|uniref:alpha/beta fold hydrolase n=1 Tax=uncultured Litoreibacter sp. TaxID=1392394 RepID=UPI0026164268|nr:alpha/beta hydrolase [uncultured Litoreibacter sp.]
MNIVILPGLDGTGALVSQLQDLLAVEHSVTAVHYPAELSRYDDIKSWLQSALPQTDYILVAESFSGPLAVMIGASCPRQLKGIVFVASFARSPRRLPAISASLLRFLPVKSRVFTGLAQPVLMGKWSSAAFTRSFTKSLRIVPLATLSARLREVLRVDVTDKIAQIKAPYTYLQATHDRLVPAKISNDFNTGAGKVTLVAGPHFLLQANPEDTAKHILAFAAQQHR